MDRGRNLEALAEEDGEEEMEEHHGDSDSEASSTSEDDQPDEGTKRGEPNKFDIHCDGVSNAMALVHTALEELLEMKDLMLKHNLPPPLLIKLTTNTGKVFRSVNDLDSAVNELVRLVRLYSTPWEEKSAALKKLHEDYEIKQRQLNIAIKRLQLVDTHSKRIAKEKRVMNWEKLFAKMMSNKGHGRRWKFLIETIKQKAKLGLEHVQEYTKALEESSDEEEDEMPTIQLRSQERASPTSVSDKQSEDESRQEDEDENGQEEEEGEKEEEGEGEGELAGEESASEGEAEEKAIPSIKIQIEALEEEDEELAPSPESAKKVRFVEEQKPVPKVETHDATVSTETPDYDRFLFVRMYTPIGLKQEDMKCSVTFGKQFYKTKKLEPHGKKIDISEPSTADIKKGSFEEAMFSVPDTVPDGIWQQSKPKELPPQNCQISVHSGPVDMIVAMATIDLADLKELNLREIFLPPPHGDDDVPHTPEPPDDDDLHSLSSDVEIPLPDDDKKPKEEPVKEDYVKDVDPMMFPLYSLDGSTSIHKPCGKLPLIFYWGKKARPLRYNRQVGTHGIHDLVFEMTGIDLETTTKEELQKDMQDMAVSPIDFTPKVQDRAISVIRFTPEEPPPSPTPEQPPPSPTPSPEEDTQEHISPKLKEEMVPKFEYDKLMEKHSKDILIVQEEYEKRLQSLLNNIQALEQTQALHQQQIMHQQQQIQQQQKQLSAAKKSQEKRQSSARHSPVPTVAPPVTPAKQIGPASEEVSQPIIHPPMPPQKKRKAPPRPHITQPPPQYKSWEGIPEDFLERLDYFEYLSYHHKQDLADKTKQEIQEDIEKKLAGQHKLSKKDEDLYEALNDVSLPALFMPFARGTVFNPRAHQYFHPTGSTSLRLTQPPSVFQLPPLQRSKSSVLNLFELSKNFNRGQGWLMDKYIQQQEPVKNAPGAAPQPSAPTSRVRSPPFTPQHTLDMPSAHGEAARQRVLEQEAEC